ncbi:unnamed protein product [Rotaria sp. Silwood1]|nr:unnamed protein product [Rotaria sp. Silwood1]
MLVFVIFQLHRFILNIQIEININLKDFFRSRQTLVTTRFGPITYPPASVFAFKQFPDGTHGHMKCLFDGIFKSQGTVFMNLYKSVHPQWIYETIVDSTTRK